MERAPVVVRTAVDDSDSAPLPLTMILALPAVILLFIAMLLLVLLMSAPDVSVTTGALIAACVLSAPLEQRTTEDDVPVEVSAPFTVSVELAEDVPPADTLMLPAPVMMPVLTFPSAAIEVDWFPSVIVLPVPT